MGRKVKLIKFVEEEILMRYDADRIFQLNDTEHINFSTEPPPPKDYTSKIEYRIIRVTDDPEDWGTFYAINMDHPIFKLFARFKEVERQSYEFNEQSKVNMAKEITKYEIRQLPWWKRLFNKF